MFEPLFLADMVLAFAVLVAAAALGRRTGRWALYVTAVPVAARLVVAALLMTGGPQLAGTRLLVQLPLAVLPLTAAFVWPEARRPAAVGVALSAVWLFIPYAQAETPLTLAVSLVAMGATVAMGHRRGPWATLGFVAAPAVVLFLAFQGNVAVSGHHDVPAASGGHRVHRAASTGSPDGPAGTAGSTGVTALTGPRDRTPDVRVTLTAAHGHVTLGSGRRIDALTFNGQTPGPQIRVRTGQLLEVTLRNTDVEEGVTVHWHGVDVPNAEDGVPGVTQEAVPPGGTHVYRFVPDRAGTFWYHTHRDSSLTVARGLFGSLIVEDGPAPRGVERTVFTHLWPGDGDPIAAFDTADRPARQAVAAGEPVLLRLINSSEEPHLLHLGGTPYTVTAVDGNTIPGATPVAAGTDLLLAAGGRFDLAFVMPRGAVTVSIDVNEIPNTAALVLVPESPESPEGVGGPEGPEGPEGRGGSDGAGGPAAASEPGAGPRFDALTYGTAEPVGRIAYDRTYDVVLDDGFGFAQGSFGYVSSSINGRLYPAVPTLTVTEGERVKIRIVNRSLIDHPMHLHGHRVRVLSRNGAPAAGTWRADSLNVAPGEIFEVDFTADNPGIWMDHCHNFKHGSEGMVMHLAYTGVTSSFRSAHIPE
ncbi:multicopper oxidase family protein [Streptosporangium sp. NPDC023615]|uniref:multicopper oxidase family protein n=1 Tax=Streptosporangium sp. NPDC023615 TaxID=3154794 RepID=UPI00342D19EF